VAEEYYSAITQAAGWGHAAADRVPVSVCILAGVACLYVHTVIWPRV